MKVGREVSLILIIALLSVLCIGCGVEKPGETESNGATAEEVKRISLATGGTSGTYYPIGSGITAVISKYAENIEATAESTGASVANSKMLRDEQIELIMVSASTALSAYSGADAFEGSPAENMRGVAALYPEIFQFVTLEESGLQKVEDLKGKKGCSRSTRKWN